jgi:uncharacterized protein (DUF1778 family)
MSKIREEVIRVRVSGSLRAELEQAAADDGRDLSSLVRKILIDHTAQRMVERETLKAA